LRKREGRREGGWEGIAAGRTEGVFLLCVSVEGFEQKKEKEDLIKEKRRKVGKKREGVGRVSRQEPHRNRRIGDDDDDEIIATSRKKGDKRTLR